MRMPSRNPFFVVAASTSPATPWSHSSHALATRECDIADWLTLVTLVRHSSISRFGSTRSANSTRDASSSRDTSSCANMSPAAPLGPEGSSLTPSFPRKHDPAAATARAGSAKTLASAPPTRSTPPPSPKRLRVARIHARRVCRYSASARSELNPSTATTAASADAIVLCDAFGDSSAFRAARAICALIESITARCCLNAGNFLTISSRVRCGGAEASAAVMTSCAASYLRAASAYSRSSSAPHIFSGVSTRYLTRDPAANTARSGVSSVSSFGARSASAASLFFLMISGSSARLSRTCAKPPMISLRLASMSSMSFVVCMNSRHDPPIVRRMSSSIASAC